MREKWDVIHDYRRAVRRGLASPLTCPEDGVELVPVIDPNDGPALRCTTCLAVYSIGLDMWDQMKAAI